MQLFLRGWSWPFLFGRDFKWTAGNVIAYFNTVRSYFWSLLYTALQRREVLEILIDLGLMKSSSPNVGIPVHVLTLEFRQLSILKGTVQMTITDLMSKLHNQAHKSRCITAHGIDFEWIKDFIQNIEFYNCFTDMWLPKYNWLYLIPPPGTRWLLGHLQLVIQKYC